jgi:hypothetical protein
MVLPRVCKGFSSILTHVEVKDVRAGDWVTSGEETARVICVVKTVCFGGKTQLVTLPGGLKITPWHPIKVEGLWRFPCDLAEVQVGVPCAAVYSFLLDKTHTILINEIECVTLAHGFEGEVVSHPYYGSSAVVRDLMKMGGWENGFVVLRAGCAIRGDDGLVVGLSPDHEIVW